MLLKGREIRDTRPEALSQIVSLVYQNPEDMFIKDSVEADIAFAMRERQVPDWRERTAQLLERFRLTELKDRDGRLLSGGQMRRASLAIGVALNPEILLLTDPAQAGREASGEADPSGGEMPPRFRKIRRPSSGRRP